MVPEFAKFAKLLLDCGADVCDIVPVTSDRDEERLAELLRARIASAREQAAISQGELASYIGLDNTAISKIEQGKRTISSLELARIAARCGKPLSWFFDEQPSLVANFRGADEINDVCRQNVSWLAEFADAYAFLSEQLASA
jgi:transcriptional regulator with XRE-family HTH domain